MPIIKYKTHKSRLRAPSHTHWIVDLIVKTEYNPSVVKDFVTEWLELYELIEPFKTTEERNNYEFFYNDYFTTPFCRLWSHNNQPKSPHKDVRHLD